MVGVGDVSVKGGWRLLSPIFSSKRDGAEEFSSSVLDEKAGGTGLVSLGPCPGDVTTGEGPNSDLAAPLNSWSVEIKSSKSARRCEIFPSLSESLRMSLIIP